MRMKRWSLEVTFEESRAHLGIEMHRQWSDLAIERSTPLLFGLYSLVTLGWRGRCTQMDKSGRSNGLVSQADRHLSGCARGRQAASVGAWDFSHIPH